MMRGEAATMELRNGKQEKLGAQSCSVNTGLSLKNLLLVFHVHESIKFLFMGGVSQSDLGFKLLLTTQRI